MKTIRGWDRRATIPVSRRPRSDADLITMIALMGMSKHHVRYNILDIRRLIIPPLILGQYQVYESQKRTLGFVTWGWLNEIVIEGYLNGNRLIQPDDWESGDYLWMVDFVSSPLIKMIEIRSIIKDIGNLIPEAQEVFYRRGFDGKVVKHARTGRTISVLRRI